MPKFFEFVSTVRKRSVDLFTKPSGMTEWQLFAHHCRPPSVITSRGIVSLPNRERAVSRLRTVAIAPGKVAEAVGFAHQVAKHAEKITGLKVGVSMPIGGTRSGSHGWRPSLTSPRSKRTTTS